MATDVQVLNSESRTVERNSLAGFDKKRVEEVIAEGSLNFDEWTSLISEIENSFPDDIEILGLVYESFFAEFPLCYGYWRKYADHKARLCTIDEVVEVYERAVESATYSVDMWFQYCSFSMSAFEDPDDIRRLFKRGLSFVGKDYLCHTLWDKYIEFEFSHEQWSSLAQIYVQALRFPSKKLHWYYASFKKLADAWKEELECQSDSGMEFESELALKSEVPTYFKDDEISSVVKDMLDPSLGIARSKSLQKYLFIGEQIYKEACQLDEKINCFENRISRPYFHVKPLNDSQLKNWNDYLNFAEEKGDFDWVVKLYERCLIPCAYYPEFWMRYVDYMESKGGREIANYALARATQTFLKRVPVIHVFSARYKEQIGDIYAARAAFLKSNMDSDSSFIENLAIQANMEKRLGNFVAACNIYKEALETAAERKKLHTLPMLFVNLSRLTYMTTDSADAARDILIDGIKRIPSSKLLLEELIKFVMMHGGSRHINAVEAVIAKALYSGPDVLKDFSLQDVEDISSLYLQFVDLCGTIGDVRSAWNRHIRYFAHSMRTGYECPARETKSLRTDMEGQLESIVALPPQPSGSEHLIHSPSKDRTLSPPEKYDSQSDQPSTSLLSNQRSPSSENQDIQSDSTAVDLLHSGEADSNSQEMMLQVPPEVMERDGVDACEPKVLSVEVVHQIANETEAVQASEEFSKEDAQQGYDPDCKQGLKPLSLEGLSINPGNNDSPDSVCATSHEGKAPEETSQSHESMLKIEAAQENSLSDGSMLEGGENINGSHFASSLMGTQASGSVPIQTGTVSPSSLGSHQNFIPEAHSWPQTPANGSRNWHQKHNPDRIRRDSRFGFRGHSHRRQYQQRQSSSQQYPRAETGAHVPMNPGYPSQPMPSANPQVQQCSQAQSQFPASANLTASQAWPMQNVPQQNFASACQSQPAAQPVFNPQAQISPYPTQYSEQHELLQNNLAYNQMWQYYYYQQQQFFLHQQQQQMQQQQHLQQLQQQQSNQEQQYQQQQYFQRQQQQLQAMQQQQQSQFQQQLLQQQRLLYWQHHQVEQHHLQQQEEQLPQQQQQEQEQRKSEQKITTSWNNNCSQQDQGTAPCHNTGAFVTATSAASPSPRIQQQSPQS